MRMLSKKDIELIVSTREDVRKLRTKDIYLYGSATTGRHPVTKEPIVVEIEYPLKAVVTEVSLRTSVDRYRHLGVEILTGDVIIDISYQDVPDGLTTDEMEYVKHDDLRFTVLSAVKLGLGGVNRVVILGRRTQ